MKEKISMGEDIIVNIPNKPQLHHTKSEKLTNKYFNEKNKNEITIEKTLKRAVSNLKKIDLLFITSEFELEKYGSSTLPAFLEQDEIINNFYFFATIIGVIDGQIDENIRQINWNKQFIVNIANDESWEKSNKYRENEILEHQKQIESLITDRNNILLDMKEFNLNYKDCYRKLYIDVLTKQPSYTMFNKLYNDIKEGRRYQYNIQIELINAYNIGYTKSQSKPYREMYSLYNELLNDINEYRKNNNFKLKEEKANVKVKKAH